MVVMQPYRINLSSSLIDHVFLFDCKVVYFILWHMCYWKTITENGYNAW